MPAIRNNPQTWHITLQGYEAGEWGTSIGSFKVPASIIKRFRKVDPATGANTFDVISAFNNLAQTYINALLVMFKFLRAIIFDALPEELKRLLRQVIYLAIEHACLNKQIWENVNGSSIGTPNFNISVDSTNWLMTSDMFGMKAWNLIQVSDLQEWDFIDADDDREFKMKLQTKNGNYITYGYIDLDKIPELI